MFCLSFLLLSWRIMPLLMEEILQEFTSTVYYHTLSQISYVIRSINISPKGFIRVMLLWWTDHSSKVGGWMSCGKTLHRPLSWTHRLLAALVWWVELRIWEFFVPGSYLIIIALALMKQKWLDGFPNHQHLVAISLCRELWLLFSCSQHLSLASLYYLSFTPRNLQQDPLNGSLNLSTSNRLGVLW